MRLPASVKNLFAGFYLEFDHGAEVVIPKKDAEFSFLHSRGELTQAVVRQLSGRAVEELLRHDTCHKTRCSGKVKKKKVIEM